MLLYNPTLDVTIVRTERQAEVLAGAGWVPADEQRPWIDPQATSGEQTYGWPDPEPSSDRTWLDPEPQDDTE